MAGRPWRRHDQRHHWLAGIAGIVDRPRHSARALEPFGGAGEEIAYPIFRSPSASAYPTRSRRMNASTRACSIIGRSADRCSPIRISFIRHAKTGLRSAKSASAHSTACRGCSAICPIPAPSIRCSGHEVEPEYSITEGRRLPRRSWLSAPGRRARNAPSRLPKRGHEVTLFERSGQHRRGTRRVRCPRPRKSGRPSTTDPLLRSHAQPR